MTYFIGVTTYNRRVYLSNLLKSWNSTRDKSSNWILVVADDGSTDGTIEFLESLQFSGVDVVLIKNDRVGIHRQTNTILQKSCEYEFDIGFKCDDDVVFIKKGWDSKYELAVRLSGYDHLVFMDPNWYDDVKLQVVKEPKGLLQKYNSDDNHIQGAFWTFTKRVIDTVGYFDTTEFGWCGYGHVDYTMRCCRAGFNKLGSLCDACDSQDFLKLVKSNYEPAVSNSVRFSYNTQEQIEYKKKKMKESRLYVRLQE